MITHLHQAHVLAEVPQAVVASRDLAGCPHCLAPFRQTRWKTGHSSLRAHIGKCAVNPDRSRRRQAPAAAAAADGSTTARPRSAASADAAAVSTRIVRDPGAWRAAREAFLAREAPDAAGWANLTASGARTSSHVPAAAGLAWRLLGGEPFATQQQTPERAQATLWTLALLSLMLHVPTPTRTVESSPPRLSISARATALLEGDFAAALADRDGSIWRPPHPQANAPPPRKAGRPGAAVTAGHRRALAHVRVGRLGAAARALQAEPPVPQTVAIWGKASDLFPPEATAQATTASVA